MTNLILLLLLLQIKHFIWDFWYQPPYMWQNKGTFLHLGGIIHSGLHAKTTFLILAFFTDIKIAAALSVAEFFLHYGIDWAKMNINRIKGWTATTHNEFWQLTGFDQLLHQLTYLLIIFGVQACLA